MQRLNAIIWLTCVLVCAAGMLSSVARADEWSVPKREHWSNNHRYVLHVDWQNRRLKLAHVTPQGEAELWAISSPLGGLGGAPYHAYIGDDGRSVVLQDGHGELGYGKVLVFLGERGQTLHAYTLDDLFSRSEIYQCEITSSSIWWSFPELFRFTDRGDRFGLLTHWGSLAVFDPATGTRLPKEASDVETFCAEARRILRADLQGGDVARGIMLAGLLKDQESLPRLKQLLTDPSHCIMISGRHRDNYYTLQLAAGKALVRILGREATPLLKSRLVHSNPSMRAAWTDLIAQARTAPESALALLRPTKNREGTIRDATRDARKAPGAPERESASTQPLSYAVVPHRQATARRFPIAGVGIALCSLMAVCFYGIRRLPRRAGS